MAVNYVNIDVVDLSFPAMVENSGFEDILVTFTNQSGPSASVDVVVDAPSAPFSVASGSLSFNLPGNGTSASILFRFTPTAIGDFANTLNVTATPHPPAVDVWQVQPRTYLALTGHAFSNIYTLPEIANMACGTVRPTLIMPTSAPELTIPTSNTFLDIGEFVEAAQEQLSQSSAATLSLRAYDDTSVYAAGFWWTVCKYDFQLRVYLDEGAGDTFLFYGSLQPQQTRWQESNVGTLGYIRDVELALLSAEGVLYATQTSDWVTEVLAHSTIIAWPSAPGVRGVIKLVDLFECMLVTSGLNSWVSGDGYDIVCEYNLVDLQYFYSGTAYAFDKVAMSTSIWNSSVNPTYDILDYWDNTNAHGHSLAVKHATLQEMISSLLFNFGLTMRMDYDTVSERHKIHLVQSGRADTTSTTENEAPTESEIIVATNLIGDAVRVNQEDGSRYVYASKKYAPSGSTEAVPSPDYISFDIDRQILYNLLVPDILNLYNMSRQFYLNTAPGVYPGIDDLKVWLYDSAAYYDRGAFDQWSMLDAICKYNFHRIPSSNKKQINRTYPSLQSIGGSHRDIHIMRRIPLDIGDGVVYWFANRVTKRLSDNDLLVEWIEE